MSLNGPQPRADRRLMQRWTMRPTENGLVPWKETNADTFCYHVLNRGRFGCWTRARHCTTRPVHCSSEERGTALLKRALWTDWKWSKYRGHGISGIHLSCLYTSVMAIVWDYRLNYRRPYYWGDRKVRLNRVCFVTACHNSYNYRTVYCDSSRKTACDVYGLVMILMC